MGMETGMHPIDQVFSGALRDNVVPPPPDGWVTIERELNRKRRLRAIVIIRSVAASVALALAFAGGYYVADRHHAVTTTQPVKYTAVPVHQSQASGNDAAHSTVQPADAHYNGKHPSAATPGERPLAEAILPVTEEKSIRNEGTHSGTNLLSSNSSREKPPALMSSRQPTINPPDYEAVQAIAGKLEALKLAAPVDDGDVVYADISGDESPATASHWSLGGQASPLYAFRSTNVSSDRVVTNLAGASSSLNETGIVSYGGGLNVQYKATSRLSVSTGVYYSRMGQRIHGSELIPSGTVVVSYAMAAGTGPTSMTQNGSSGFIDRSKSAVADPITTISPNKSLNETSASTRIVDLRQNMDFLEIPLMVRYKIIDRKIGLHLLGGLSTNILAGNSVMIDNGSGFSSYGRTSGLSTLNYTSIMGLGLDYGLSASLKASIEPAFRYYLNSINTSNPADTHPYSFGIYTGIAYSF